jgi:predicted GNAT family acetyltransferase
MELSTAANWNQTHEDWHRLLQLAPEGCRFIGDDGKVVATTSTVAYGTKLAWIGMVLTRPEYRKRGLARLLMEDAITSAERYDIQTLKLDATDQGRPLYESLGFVVEKTVERWGRDEETPYVAQRKTQPGDRAVDSLIGPEGLSDELFVQDKEAFGAAREILLRALLATNRCNVTATGFALSRPGRTAHYLGPCVASSETVAQQLIAARLEGCSDAYQEGESKKPRRWYWDLLPENSEVILCAKKLGFTRRRILWRMRRGEVLKNNDAMVYAIAGFEFG